MEIFQIFDQNHGLIRLEKLKFFDFLKLIFSLKSLFFFYLECLKSIFPSLFCQNQSN